MVNQDFVQKWGAILEGGEVANIGITCIVENICKQTITNYRSNYASLKEFSPIPENIDTSRVSCRNNSNFEWWHASELTVVDNSTNTSTLPGSLWKTFKCGT